MAKQELVKGKLPDGTEREWAFTLLGAKPGLKLLHGNHGLIMMVVTLYERLLEEDPEKGLTEGEFLATVLHEDWTQVEAFSDELLDGVEYGTTIEFYAALYYALISNFEATINPMRTALVPSDESDSTEPNTQQNNAEAE